MTLRGHRTSVALEPAFWSVLDTMVQQRDIPFAQLLTQIDEARGTAPLASALRVAALVAVQDGGASSDACPSHEKARPFEDGPGSSDR